MHLTNIAIHNFKSLKNVELAPSPLSCLVGPNASGKSNFADALHFLGEVYEHGLGVAVARKGGYENIAFRRQRRSKAPLRFSISIEGFMNEMVDVYSYREQKKKSNLNRSTTKIFCTHTFSFSAKGQSIRAPFTVNSESFDCWFQEEGKAKRLVFRFDRKGDDVYSIRSRPNLPEEIMQYIDISIDAIRQNKKYREIPPHSLVISHFFLADLNSFCRLLVSTSSKFRVFRLTPEVTRREGVPIPNAKLSFQGENLPALVDWLQQNHQKRWRKVMNAMKSVMPSLSTITVDYSPSKTLQLFFLEEKSGRPWIADDISDGTIQTLAMLVALSDPRGSLLLIEEPENSIHPWIIRMLIEQFRELSVEHTVMLTSHSRTLIDLLNPSELWIVSRRNLETHIHPISHYDANIQKDWENGKYKLSEVLDAGLVPAAVPGGLQE